MKFIKFLSFILFIFIFLFQPIYGIIQDTLPVYSSTLSQSGHYLVTGHSQNTIVVWDLKNGSKVQSFKTKKSILSLKISTDEQTLIVIDQGNTLYFFDIFSGRLKSEVQDSLFLSQADLAILPTDNLIVVASGKQLRFYDLKTFKLKRELETSHLLTSITIQSHSKQLAYSTRSKEVVVLDIESGKIVRVFKDKNVNPIVLTFHPTQPLLVSGGAYQKIIIWNIQTGKKEQVMNGHKSYITDLEFDASGKNLFSSSLDQTVIVWDFLSKKNKASY